jgi:hypothetical protein
MRIGSVGFEWVDSPHGKVADQQEGDHLAAWLLLHLISVVGESGTMKIINWFVKLNGRGSVLPNYQLEGFKNENFTL